jgi:hypothetical protein
LSLWFFEPTRRPIHQHRSPSMCGIVLSSLSSSVQSFFGRSSLSVMPCSARTRAPNPSIGRYGVTTRGLELSPHDIDGYHAHQDHHHSPHHHISPAWHSSSLLASYCSALTTRRKRPVLRHSGSWPLVALCLAGSTSRPTPAVSESRPPKCGEPRIPLSLMPERPRWTEVVCPTRRGISWPPTIEI